MGITHPIQFENIDKMNQFYSNFETKAKAICKRYDVPELWSSIRMYKDEESLELSITSVGAHLKGSNEEKAANEIINAFNNL